MKKLIAILSLTIIMISIEAQDCKKSWDEFIDIQTHEFTNKEESPLTENDFDKFIALDYYDYDMAYCVEARFKRTPDEEPFEMATSTERTPTYVKYGILYFELKGEKQQLALYQSPDLVDSEEYGDYLFLPFGDATNGLDTYGSGRFMDFRIPEGDTIQLDFNKSYNPLCAYNHKYSCPRPPAENMLSIDIKSGVKGVKLDL